MTLPRELRDNSSMDTLEHGNRERWEPGDTAFFEYHCLESPESSDALAWYHSHQRVTVLGRNEVEPGSETDTFEERGEAGWPWTYLVRFPDGLVWSAWEDELYVHPRFYYRPDPPPVPVRQYGRWKTRLEVPPI